MDTDITTRFYVCYLGHIIAVDFDVVTFHSNQLWWMIEKLQKFSLNVLQLHLHLYSTMNFQP